MTRDARYHPFWVLAVSGLLGFRIGLVGYPTWQIAVETAQAVAGVVPYPPDNPFFVYHTKLWSLAIQICALLVRAGMSEITLSLLLSGVIGMISFQALSLITYAISGSALLAIGGAFVVFVSKVTDHGVVYPVFLLGTHHTYGALGLSLLTLAIALLAAGCLRSGAFLLGVAPAVHPSVGIWIGAVAAIAFAWDFGQLRDAFRPAAKYFTAGCLVTVISFLVQVIFIEQRIHADPSEVARTFATFVSVWDDHRRAGATLSNTGVIFNRLALAMGLVWLIGFARDLTRPSLFLLRVVVVGAIAGLAFVVLSWVPPDRLPMTLSILMPARLLNFNVLVVAPVMLGLIGVYRRRLSAQCLAFVFLAGLLLIRGSMFWEWAAQHQWHPWSVAFDPVMLIESTGVVLVCIALSNTGTARNDTFPARLASLVMKCSTAIVLVIAFAVGWQVMGSRSMLRDRTNDPFFREVAGDHRGLVVTAGTFQLMQLYTRRPVLIDAGALDTMVYAPETGPAVAQILHDVYGIDFFHPPPGVRSASAVPHDLCKAYWATLKLEDWKDIRRKYNVTQIVARTDYAIDLPIAAETDQLRLYRIP